MDQRRLLARAMIILTRTELTVVIVPARDYASNNRKMIHEAFDRGVIKAVVLNALRVGFETAAPSE